VDSQLRKLPPPMAQHIAARLKGAAPEAAPASSAQKSPSQQGTSDNPTARSADARGPGQSGPGQAGTSDLQQVISHIPASTLADLNKGDAVMVVATSGTDSGGVTAITLLAGVEPILQASPAAQSILSPWS